MLLKQLIPNIDEKFANIDVCGITSDSRKVSEGYVFVCIKGSVSDGHDYAESAVKNGASIIITERSLGYKNEFTVEDTQKLYADMCAVWFGHPAKSLTVIGITGTNGKTSISYMLKAILEHTGKKCGLIGTIQNMIGDEVFEAKNTTPGIYELNELFAGMRDAGCSHVIMEVSSHALDQRRVEGIEFELGLFTNLTQDHLDYHKTMENYMEAKRKLFEASKTAVLNYDDEFSAPLTDGLDCEKITYSAQSDFSTYTAKNISYRPDGVEYEFVGLGTIGKIRLSTGGKFSVYNSMCAVAAALKLGVSLPEISEALAKLRGVKGRAEVVPTGTDYTVIIDYAHTPDGLKNILNTFRECQKNRLVVLFGCGGDRDKTKRPLMGGVAARLADFVIVTSDNPRSENPEAIIEDILVGLKGTTTPYKVITNRIQAIKFAIKNAQPGDIIVLAGKGHETYQILDTGTIHLDEREVVAEALKEN
ncbi:MAG: UDP-N-acetylmuramoyl-L-alanyl-D-glutamate--2,6-diaminopimelate ligase [Clostridia bacterium]|nr:UDP-N-acetylmuramoyl-L-alanyl-D-glutamate--2,6-diaminopimelate ligase [Clostridia bacterium]